ncbi:Sec-independent protein translocase TatB [Microbacterium rhizosphaerae]|uniref:Sec-independent protein translocase TatB n=1 Tax=Microbacterium rhizosphaerae TaxID=1678237 RepID=A0ABZ0SMF0_9MICO|nr:Sec-independent protein translocase TatB [Microbacterium rhizosphaerae]WPR88447.1 Sec-independent protein translocase TatB [Microbacterium rhizosphaerae]
MIFGLTIEKLLVIGVIAAFLVGPERLPRYAASLAQFTVRAREFIRGARDRVKDEMGEDFDDLDWRTLDPRQYDPRRIIREALLDDAPVASVATAAAAAPAAAATIQTFVPGDVPPFDAEAT